MSQVAALQCSIHWCVCVCALSDLLHCSNAAFTDVCEIFQVVRSKLALSTTTTTTTVFTPLLLLLHRAVCFVFDAWWFWELTHAMNMHDLAARLTPLCLCFAW